MKVLGPCAAAEAAWEVVAGAEALEEADEDGVVPVPEAEPDAVPEAALEAVPEAVLEAGTEVLKVTPCKTKMPEYIWESN